jgi:hypothetical protein
LHWSHPGSNAGTTPTETEHGASWLFEHHDLSVRLRNPEPIERDLQGFGHGLASCLHPLHLYRGLPRRRVTAGSEPDGVVAPGASLFGAFGPRGDLPLFPFALAEAPGSWEVGERESEEDGVPAGLAPALLMGGFVPVGPPVPLPVPAGRPDVVLPCLVARPLRPGWPGLLAWPCLFGWAVRLGWPGLFDWPVRFDLEALLRF